MWEVSGNCERVCPAGTELLLGSLMVPLYKSIAFLVLRTLLSTDSPPFPANTPPSSPNKCGTLCSQDMGGVSTIWNRGYFFGRQPVEPEADAHGNQSLCKPKLNSISHTAPTTPMNHKSPCGRNYPHCTNVNARCKACTK